MFKKLLFAAALSLITTTAAFATCTNPLAITANAGAVNMSVSQNTADGGCQYNIAPMQGGAPLSATNGWYSNILQGNAALSATNGIYANILQGNAANSVSNPFYFLFGTGATLPGFASTPTFNLGTLNGAATAVKQPALGTAGTPATDVISVQGVSGGTPQPVSVASGVPDLSSTFSITSSTNSTALALAGTQSAQFNLTGTFSATVTGQVSNDNTNWVNVPILNMTTGAWVAPGTGVTAVGNYMLAGSQGAGWARINVTYTSGTVAGAMRATTQGPSATWGDYLNWVALGTLNTTAGTPGTLSSQYPSGATAITASTTGTTAATTATLAGTSGKTTYVCGYSIRANATANTNVTNTLTGVITGTMSSIMWVPANTAGLGVDEQIFQPCIPASAQNTAIAAVSGAPGTGGLVSVKAWGYQQ